MIIGHDYTYSKIIFPNTPGLLSPASDATVFPPPSVRADHKGFLHKMRRELLADSAAARGPETGVQTLTESASL